LQKIKWAEVNLLAPTRELEAEPEAPRLPWGVCRDALERAMRADNLRPSYVADALLMFDGLHRMFPELQSPADMTADLANEYKRRRAEGDPERGIARKSPWTIKGDLATLKAIFGKWLGRECGLLVDNPFAKISAPKCDRPSVRLVSADEMASLFQWFGERWNNWQLPIVYFRVAEQTAWRATEIASLRECDLLPDGYVRIPAEASKTRREKFAQLPADLAGQLRACVADGMAFGRFADELRRLLILWKRQPHHAARVRDFSPERLVGWLQDELDRFNDHQAVEAAKVAPPATWEPFTLHNFRKTGISAMQMAGVSEKEASVQVGCTPEVMRQHYERLDGMLIASRNATRRAAGAPSETIQMHQARRAGAARPNFDDLDERSNRPQTVAV